MIHLHYTPNTEPVSPIGPRLLFVMKPPYYFTSELYGSATVLSVSGETMGTREEFLERVLRFVNGLEIKSNIEDIPDLEKCQNAIKKLAASNTHDILFPMRDDFNDIPALIDLLSRKGRARSSHDSEYFYFEISVGYMEIADDLAGDIVKSL